MEKKQDEVVDYYDAIASTYDDSRFGNSYGRFIDAEERRVMDRLIDVSAEESRLDMACGTGRLTNYATHGLDASDEMMKPAKERHPSVVFTQASATETGFPDGMFDVVYSFHLLMHLPEATVGEIFKEASRILKPGGRFIMDIPSKKRRQLFHHKQESWHGGTQMTISEVSQMASEASMSVNHTYGILMLPVHRMPERMRKPLLKFDSWLANGWLKQYSSYIVCELVKH